MRPLSRGSECPDRRMDTGWSSGGTPVDLSALPYGEHDHGPKQSRWGCNRNVAYSLRSVKLTHYRRSADSFAVAAHGANVIV